MAETINADIKAGQADPQAAQTDAQAGRLDVPAGRSDAQATQSDSGEHKFAQINAPIWRDLVSRMLTARGVDDGGPWGGGVILLGAGCSISAGIPGALGVVDLALRYLAKRRLANRGADIEDGRQLYEALRKHGIAFESEYGPDLYHHLFDGPLQHPRLHPGIISPEPWAVA